MKNKPAKTVTRFLYLAFMRYLCLFITLLYSFHTRSQSTPQPLRTDITVKEVMPVQHNAVRLAYDNTTNTLYYNTSDGSIYKILFDAGGLNHDMLVYTVQDHGIQYLMGMVFHNGILYLSGNNDQNTAFTTGLIMKGVPDQSGNRQWSLVAKTEPYETAGRYDHLMSGMLVNPTGDTIILCSGSRGDHGEVETRSQQFPGLRNTVLTSIILCIPTSANQLVLKKDSQWLASNGYVFARGARNYFDMRYCANGDLFALENSCDRDHNEEMNWLRRGMHYGFPWKMGSTLNPVTSPGYDRNSDLLLPIDCGARGDYFYDSLFPPIPPGLTFADPIPNFGPDADKFKDPATGMVSDASDQGIPIQTFTAHRSPLGLVFDNDSILIDEFHGHAFMLSYNKGLDSAHSLPPNNRIGPFLDPSEDLIHLELEWDQATANYKLHATKVVVQFNNPVDAEMIGNTIYVMENNYQGNPMLWAVELPKATSSVPEDFRVNVYPNPATDYIDLNIFVKEPTSFNFDITDTYGRAVLNLTESELQTGNNTVRVAVQDMPQGIYFLRMKTTDSKSYSKLVVYR